MLPARRISTRSQRAAAFPAIALALTLVLAGCGADSPAPAASVHGDGASPSRPVLPRVAVAVEPATRGDIATYYTATASLDPAKQADILARVGGVVVELCAEEGDHVTTGQELLHIEPDEYRHRMTLADVDVEQQRLRFARAEKMASGGLVSTEDLDAARRDLRAAEASRELAVLELGYTRVRAPFVGRVVRRMVDQGQTVANGTPLFTLADMHRLLARVHIPAKEFRDIRTDQPVHLRVTSTGDRLAGRIDLISPLVDPSTGTVKVTVEVTEYPPSTRPGDFVEVSIVTDRHTNTLLAPRLAVVSERGRQTVFVAADGVAHRRVVEVGFEDEEHAEIVSGLDDGEVVVVQGQRSLRDGQPITTLEPMDLDDATDQRAG